MSEPLPVYEWTEPARLQETDADCAVESTEWCLYAWGRAPDDDWLEQSMQAAGVWNPEVGLCDASGSDLADWINAEYGEFGYYAENEDPVTFDQVAAEAATAMHPIALGGRGFYHWVGVRNYDPIADVILLANPAPGWQNVYSTLSRAQWNQLGGWSMVRLTHPEAESGTPAYPVYPPAPGLDYSPWYGAIGSGLLEMLEQDGVLPAQDSSTWLPLGRPVAQIEEVIGEQGRVYRWLLGPNRGFRYDPV